MKPKITVLSVGYGDASLFGKATEDALTSARQLVLRTEKNAVSIWLESRGIPFTSLDSLYETAEDFDSLCESIASLLWEKAEKAPLTYAVTDALTDGSVASLLRAKPDNGAVEILPGTGLADLYLPAFRSELPEADLRIVSAERFLRTRWDPDGSLLVTEVDNALMAGEIKLRLSERLPDGFELVFMRDETAKKRIPLYELDRQREYDHRTALFIPACPAENRGGYTPDDLDYALRLFLGTTKGAQQDAGPSLAEAAKRCDTAVETNDAEALKEALGDLLLRCMARADAAEEYDEFTKNEMMDSLIRRIRGENG